MAIWPFYLFMALAGIGAAQVARWIGYPIGWLAWKIDCWSDHRTFMICGRAIVDYECRRGVHIGEALRFAMKIMRGDA